MITIGLPGCGKSTWAKEQLHKEPGRWKRINRDDIRLMNDNYSYKSGDFEREKFVTKVSNAILKESLKSGYDVILDNIHLASKSRQEIHKIAQDHGDVNVFEKVFSIPLNEVLRRNALREGDACVPEDVIRKFADQYHIQKNGKFKYMSDRAVYHPPQGASQFARAEQDKNLPRAIICDLDGTLALLNGRNPYDASTCDNDQLNVPVAQVISSFQDRGTQIIFMSGRDSKYREPTERFLKQHTPGISYKLFMRNLGDQRKDSIIKRELFDENVANKYYVQFVIDDRNQVVKMWRELGLTVFQVADGDF